MVTIAKGRWFIHIRQCPFFHNPVRRKIRQTKNSSSPERKGERENPDNRENLLQNGIWCQISCISLVADILFHPGYTIRVISSCGFAGCSGIRSTGWMLFFSATTGSTLSPTAAFSAIHILPPDCSADHCPCTTNSALNFNCLNRTVHGTGTTFHATGRMLQFHPVRTFGKHPVRADFRAPGTVDTFFRVVLERILYV